MGRWEKDLPGADFEAHRMLFECFLCAQMTLAQLHEHMERDPAFRDFVLLEVSMRDLRLDQA